MGAGSHGMVRPEFRHDLDPAHRHRGDRPIPGWEPGPSPDNWHGAERANHAALAPAGQQDAKRHLVAFNTGGSYDNANAIRFEDKKGAEQLWLHAEKDQLTEVEHDEDKWVGNDRRKTIDHDEINHIKNDRTETVDHDETITVHNDRKERVDHNETISIGDNRTEDVGKNETIDIGGTRNVTIGHMKIETVGLAKMVTIGGAYQTTVGAAMNTTVALMQAEEVGLSKTVLVGKSFNITAGDEFTVTVGKSTLTMKSDGTISINGHTFDLGTSGEQTFKADGNITMKAKKILEN